MAKDRQTQLIFARDIVLIEGTLKSWNDERGFGFIEPREGGQEIFVHIKAFEPRVARPQPGLFVTFEIETTEKGKKRAVRVRAAQARKSAMRRRNDNAPAQWGTASYFAIPAFLFVYFVAAILWHVPSWVAGVYLAGSAVCFITYAIDKSAAIAGRWRISEGTLIALGLIGGWPGAIVAQQLLRHKSNKASFRSEFWGSVTINVLAFVTLNSPLRSIIGL